MICGDKPVPRDDQKFPACPVDQRVNLTVTAITTPVSVSPNQPNRVLAFDWRPEVHDADGLMMVMGNGEQIWRPLMNPPRVVTSSFQTENPKGFGLIQRDRRFENYEDEVEMSELSMTFIGGIDYTSEFWGVGVYFTLDLYTDTSFSCAVAVRDESFDLSAERTHPIGVAASAWYSPFADYLVAASASTGAETAIRVAFGKFF